MPVLSVVAPIEDMIVTTADDSAGVVSGYDFLDETVAGTSWAAPQVAGVVALMLKVNALLTPAQVKYILEVTATDIDKPGYDRRTGYGLLNARSAVEYAMRSDFPGDWDGDGLVAPIDAVLYVSDLATGHLMADLDLDASQNTTDLEIFLNSHSGN